MISRRAVALGIVLVVIGLAGAFAALLPVGPRKDKDKPPAADKPAADKPVVGEQVSKEDDNDLSMEVDALQTIHLLQLDRDQLAALAQLAPDAAPKDDKREAAKVSDKYHKALADLRDALATGDDAIDERTTALGDLYEQENPDLDDGVEITDAARKRGPDYLGRLSAKQVADYLAGLDADELEGPLEKLTAAFEESRMLKGAEWDDEREAVADAVGWLVAGLDAGASAKVRDQAGELLDRAHGLSDADFKAQRDDLDKAAKKLAGDVGPMEVLRRVAEYGLAELLSNPRLAAAVEARLKEDK